MITADGPQRRSADAAPRASDPIGRAATRQARRRFFTASAAGSVAAFPLFYWMLTAGTWNPLRAEVFGNFFDVQARSLLHLRWSVPAQAVAFEGFRVQGRTYLYFGPVPSLLRLPVLAVTSSLDGRLTQVSMLAAFAVLCFFAARLSWRVRVLLRGRSPVSRGEQWAVGGYQFVLGAGSIVLFLASRGLVYHETELWGAALAIAAYDAIVGFLVTPTLRGVILAGLWSGLAFLTRATVGAGPLLALGLVLGAVLLRRTARAIDEGRPTTRRVLARPAQVFSVPDAIQRPQLLGGLVVSLGLPVAIYAYINEARFGTLFSLPLNEQVYTQESAVRRLVLARNGGSLFGLKFLPTQLLALLRPDALRLQSLYPWVTFPHRASVVGAVTFDTRDWASSIPSSMPLFAVLAVIGLILVARRRRADAPNVAVLRAPVLAAIVGGLGTLTIAYVADRYLSDFLPAIVLFSVLGLHHLLIVGGQPRRWSRAVGAALVALAVASVWINFALALGYQRLLFPNSSTERGSFIAQQARIDRALPGGPRGRLHVGSQLPSTGSLGELFAIGRCAGLYWSDSRQWFAVEQSNRTGRFRLDVRFPVAATTTGPEQLVSIGSAASVNELAVERIGRTRAQFLLQQDGQTRVTSPPVTISAGGVTHVDTVLDARLHQVTITVNDRVVYSLLTPLAPGETFTIGGGPTGPARFSGTVVSRSVPTPLCDSLRGDFQVVVAGSRSGATS